MGGRVARNLHDKLAAIISTEEEVQNMDDRMEEAKKLGVQVVSEEFLDKAKTEGAIAYIKNNSICDWGTDVCIFVITDHIGRSIKVYVI